MRRAFDVDVLACPRCGGRLRLIATIEDPEAIGAILAAASREEAGRAPPAAAAQSPSLVAASGALGHPDASLAEVWALACRSGPMCLWTNTPFW